MVANNDFSVFALFTAGLAAVANAYSVGKGPVPSGNPTISPAAGDQVIVGTPYDITWTPTTPGTVTLYLCKGPSTNCVNEPVPFAVEIQNTGSYLWTASSALASSQGAGYGIQLVVDATGEYQYTPQFGITNNGPVAATSVAASSFAAVVTSIADYATATAPVYASSVANVVSSIASVASSVVLSEAPLPSGSGGVSTVIVAPTGTLTVPSNLPPVTASTVSTPAATFTGAATRYGAGMAVVGAAVAAFAL